MPDGPPADIAPWQVGRDCVNCDKVKPWMHLLEATNIVIVIVILECPWRGMQSLLVDLVYPPTRTDTIPFCV